MVLPCMIVNSFQIEYTPEVLKGLIFTVVAAVIAHIVFLILTAFLRKPLHLDMVEELTTVYTNGGILVVPLVKALLGTEYVIYSCSFLAVQMILIWTHGRHKMCSEERLSLKKIFWNANIVAICIGAFLFVTKIELPDVIGGTIDMLAEMIGPIGMLLAGMAISEIPFKKIFMEKNIHGKKKLSGRFTQIVYLSSCRTYCVQSARFDRVDRRRKESAADCLSCMCHTGLCNSYFHGTTL